jgi:serine carboxypeptidase-like clade II
LPAQDWTQAEEPKHSCPLKIGFFLSINLEFETHKSLSRIIMEKADLKVLCFSIAIALAVLSQQSLAAGEGSKEADRITALPGQPNDAAVQQYSGYINVDEKDGRTLFYYFVEATTDAAKSPLILWLNGGISFSSLRKIARDEIPT